ncbi:hypothetical protein FB99_28510 [Pantoea agglomerans]|nr:hypothetical protein FB99_28510 [Pantoea agglomerans]
MWFFAANPIRLTLNSSKAPVPCKNRLREKWELTSDMPLQLLCNV